MHHISTKYTARQKGTPKLQEYPTSHHKAKWRLYQPRAHFFAQPSSFWPLCHFLLHRLTIKIALTIRVKGLSLLSHPVDGCQCVALSRHRFPTCQNIHDMPSPCPFPLHRLVVARSQPPMSAGRSPRELESDPDNEPTSGNRPLNRIPLYSPFISTYYCQLFAYPPPPMRTSHVDCPLFYCLFLLNYVCTITREVSKLSFLPVIDFNLCVAHLDPRLRSPAFTQPRKRFWDLRLRFWIPIAHSARTREMSEPSSLRNDSH